MKGLCLLVATGVGACVASAGAPSSGSAGAGSVAEGTLSSASGAAARTKHTTGARSESSATKVCALTHTAPARPSPPLPFCRQYANYACCDAATAKGARALFTTAHPFASCPGCVHNLATLKCAIQCSPNQHRFIAPSPCLPGKSCSKADHPAKQTVELCESFCLSLFRSCGNVVPSGSAVSIIDKYFYGNRKTEEKAAGDIENDEMVAAKKFCVDQFDNESNYRFIVKTLARKWRAELLLHRFGNSTIGFRLTVIHLNMIDFGT